MRQSPRPGPARRAWIFAQALALRRIARISHRHSRLPQHLLTGIDGEREAIFYLRTHGYIVVARRWRDPKLPGDLDIIAWDQTSTPPSLCIVEIKTRSRRDFVPAEAAVDEDKQRTLRALARAYIRRLPDSACENLVRFDVLSVYLGQRSGRDLSFDLNQAAFG